MFIIDNDYKIVCGEDYLEVLSQSDADNRKKAEKIAMEEVAGYLRARYDVEKAFSADDDKRNAMLVQVTVNIALYYMVHSMPQGMGLDGYKELYDDAITWLTRVQKGAVQPDLPLYINEDGSESSTSSPFRFGSMKKNRYDY